MHLPTVAIQKMKLFKCTCKLQCDPNFVKICSKVIYVCTLNKGIARLQCGNYKSILFTFFLNVILSRLLYFVEFSMNLGTFFKNLLSIQVFHVIGIIDLKNMS